MNFLELQCSRDLLSYMPGSELLFPIGGQNDMVHDGEQMFSFWHYVLFWVFKVWCDDEDYLEQYRTESALQGQGSQALIHSMVVENDAKSRNESRVMYSKIAPGRMA